MEHLLSLTPRFRNFPQADTVKIGQFITQVRTFLRTHRSYNSPRGVVWTNVDGAIANCLETVGRLVAKDEFAFINQLVAEGQIRKAHELWLKFYVLLVEKNLDLDALTQLLTENHKFVSGVHRLQERLLQQGIVLVAIANGPELFLRKALETHAFDMPIFGNELVFDADRVYWGLELVQGPEWIDKGQVISAIAAKDSSLKPLACIGNGPSDVSMAEATNKFGGVVVSRGAKSPLTLWCNEHLPGKFLQYNGTTGLGSISPEIVARCLNPEVRAAS